jgi:putative tryptophan/tyrosine transport system substrate-binding protein
MEEAMKRRTLIAGLGGIALTRSLPLSAQQAGQRPIVAILSPGSSDFNHDPASPLNGIVARLKELGIMNGDNFDVQFRFANGDYKLLPKLAEELAALNTSVIYTYTTPSGRAAVGATSTIPIILGPVSVTTMHALVADFEHPGANLTGFPIGGTTEHGMCLRLLKEAAPGVTRLGVLFNPENPAWQGYPAVLSDVAGTLGFELVAAHAHGPSDVDQAFKEMAADRVDGLFLLSDSTLIERAALTKILDLVASNRWPSASDNGDFVTGGGLLSLAPDDVAIGRAAADYVHEILKGAKPGQLPVRAPKVLLSINLATAAKLGIAVPQSVLAKADKVVR